MIKRRQRLLLLLSSFLLFSIITTPGYGQQGTGTTLAYPLGMLAELAEYLTALAKTIKKNVSYINQNKQALVNGAIQPLNAISDGMQEAQEKIQDKVMDNVNEYKDKINSDISDRAQKFDAWKEKKTQQSDSWLEDQANGIGEWFGDQFSSTPGSGFSLDDSSKKSVKGAFTALGKVMAPAGAIASGNVAGGSAMLSKTLFLGKTNSTDKLSSYDAVTVQKNVKKYIQDATSTTIADATKIINASAQYTEKDGTASVANKQANKASNIREDIKTATEMGISMNVMTNVLMSMDITDLSIQSALIYEELNNLKNMNVRALVGGS